jgi:hypothetical protein
MRHPGRVSQAARARAKRTLLELLRRGERTSSTVRRPQDVAERRPRERPQAAGPRPTESLATK